MQTNARTSLNFEPSLTALEHLTFEGMKGVNALILSHAKSHVDMIPQIAEHLIGSGGKRIRPILTLAGAQLFDADFEKTVVLAASVEFMHTATLLHDDVVDESDLRRGKKAARMLWGNAASVLVGDYLLGQAFRMMVSTHSLQSLEVLSRAAALIAEGEVLQLTNTQSIDVSRESYMRVIEGKTATLFAAASCVGPILAGASQSDIDALYHYGLYLGIAFQLADDALDYSPTRNKLGKRAGDDFRDGKMTLPALIAIENATPEENAFWKSAIEKKNTTNEDFERAVGLVSQYKGYEQTYELARSFANKAIEQLSGFGDHPVAVALCEAALFAVSREH